MSMTLAGWLMLADGLWGVWAGAPAAEIVSAQAGIFTVAEVWQIIKEIRAIRAVRKERNHV
jgi:hypothetical protein